jgi:hypothetical protein
MPKEGSPALMEWDDRDLQDLQSAVELLENPGFIAKVSAFVGTPIEYVLDRLPKSAGNKITRAVHESLLAAVNTAAMTLSKRRRPSPWRKTHMAAVGISGGVGGVFGLAALPIELPITTTIILRSIADIARSEGEDLSDPESRMACLEVFAMGGRQASDDATESGYFAVSVVEDGAPVIVRLLAQIAARFNTVVGEKIVAQGVPIVGGVGGAAINVLFIDHFQDMARGHFIVRRLERKYGADQARERYGQILSRQVRAEQALPPPADR